MFFAWIQALIEAGLKHKRSRYLGGWEFWENFLAFRKMGILGRLRGGKTSLAVSCARRLYLEGRVRGVFSNFPIDPKYIPQVRSCVNTCVILDEAAEWADARLSSNNRTKYGRYFGKFGSWLISPCVDAMDKRLAPVRVRRVADIWAFDVWHYEYLIPDSFGTGGDFTGEFLWSGYEEVFGTYDHEFIPSDDGGILDVLDQEIKGWSGSTRRVLTHEDWNEYLREKEHAREQLERNRRRVEQEAGAILRA